MPSRARNVAMSSPNSHGVFHPVVSGMLSLFIDDVVQLLGNLRCVLRCCTRVDHGLKYAD